MARRLVAMICGCSAVGFAAGCGGQASFDPATWKQPTRYCTKSPRTRMVEDIVERRLKRGMPMRDVRALLGPPDGRDGPNLTYYFAGSEWSFFLDTCVSLEVEAANGRLRNAAVLKDD